MKEYNLKPVFLPEEIQTVKEFEKHKRTQIFMFNEICDILKENTSYKGKIFVNNYRLPPFNLKTKTFLRDYQEDKFCCSSCGLKPIHYVLFEKENELEKISLFGNFFGIKNGEEILFTHDHTLARGLGGEDSEENTTTMCSTCNNIKSKWESGLSQYKNIILKCYFEESLGCDIDRKTLKQLSENFNLKQFNLTHLKGRALSFFVLQTQSEMDKAIDLLMKFHNLPKRSFLFEHYKVKSESRLMNNFPKLFYGYNCDGIPDNVKKFLFYEINRFLDLSVDGKIKLKNENKIKQIYYDKDYNIIFNGINPSVKGDQSIKLKDFVDLYIENKELLNKKVVRYLNYEIIQSKQFLEYIRNQIQNYNNIPKDLSIIVNKNSWYINFDNIVSSKNNRKTNPSLELNKKNVSKEFLENLQKQNLSPTPLTHLTNIKNSWIKADININNFKNKLHPEIKLNHQYIEILTKVVMELQGVKKIDNITNKRGYQINSEMYLEIRKKYPSISRTAGRALASYYSMPIDQVLDIYEKIKSRNIKINNKKEVIKKEKSQSKLVNQIYIYRDNNKFDNYDDYDYEEQDTFKSVQKIKRR